MKWFPLLRIMSLLVLAFGLFMLVPLVMLVFGPDPSVPSFLRASALAVGLGGLGLLLSRRQKTELGPRDGIFMAAMVWIILSAFAALPFYWFVEDLRFSAALFEAVSAITTTGSTVFGAPEELPRALLLWRGLLQWLGGMGILVLAVAILPLLGVGGMQIFKAETPGPMKDSKLTPRIAETAKGLYGTYLLITVACYLGFVLAGMGHFDAIVHAGATVSLGGLSNYGNSFMAFDSVAIELVAVVFMSVCALNFAAHFSALRSRSLQPYRHCPEARYTLALLALGVAAVALVLAFHGMPWGEALRHAAFNVVSIATTTGFASIDYGLWPVFAPWLMILLSCVVSSSGSTGGGIKMIRLILMSKQARRELDRIVHPRAVDPVQLEGTIVSPSVLSGVTAFMLFYGLVVMVSCLLLLLTGMADTTAVSGVLASLNNMGPGLNEIGPVGNYGALSNFQLGIFTALMVLGRLELLTVLVLFSAAFWKD